MCPVAGPRSTAWLATDASASRSLARAPGTAASVGADALVTSVIVLAWWSPPVGDGCSCWKEAKSTLRAAPTAKVWGADIAVGLVAVAGPLGWWFVSRGLAVGAMA